jgi:histidine phosphotransferase ChpT
MSRSIEFRVLELLNARLCHELISPVGAVNNGVELLDDEDPDFVRDAIQLIGQSARKAGQRLQFYRFAYGSSAGAGAGGKELATALLEGGKVRCDWLPAVASLPVEWQRLACNLVVLAAEVLPRGGTVVVRPPSHGATGVEVVAEGESINLTTELRAALDPGAAVEQLSPRTIHAYFTARLAGTMGASLRLGEADPQRLLLFATVS